MSIPRQALNRLRELAASGELAHWCGRLGIDLLVAFGSATDPRRAEQARDLDLAVLISPGAASDVVEVVNALVDLVHCDRVDILDLARASVVAQEQALVGTLPLHEREPGLLAAIRDRAIVRRMDTDWLRKLDVDLMAAP
jgi:predicted nucleotidyltransferase